MFGDREEARVIAEYDVMELDEYEYAAPAGFEYVGEGASRIAFRNLESGIIYKKDYSPLEGSNLREYECIQRVKEIPLKGWRVPECELFRFEGNVCIIAMEYVTGAMDVHCQRSYHNWSANCNCGKPLGMCSADAWEQPCGKWGLTDIHTGNIVIDNGIRVLIDLGE